MGNIKDILEYIFKIFKWWVSVHPWERGLRIRMGKRVKVLQPGFHFRLPFFDSVYIQPIRLRSICMSPMTVTNKSDKTITVVPVVGYSINDIQKVFNSIHHPEATICNIVSGEISEFISKNEDCAPEKIQESVIKKLSGLNYGIDFEYIKITGYAVVRTLRLIQDCHWTPNELKLDEVK